MTESTKKASSFRLEEEQLRQLDSLTTYYKQAMFDEINQNFQVKVSKASVLEFLIREKYNELNAEGKL